MVNARTAQVVRPEVPVALRASEMQRSIHERLLDGVRKFLEDHAMVGKTGAREFYEFEKTLHARLMEAGRDHRQRDVGVRRGRRRDRVDIAPKAPRKDRKKTSR